MHTHSRIIELGGWRLFQTTHEQEIQTIPMLSLDPEAGSTNLMHFSLADCRSSSDARDTTKSQFD